MTLSYYEDMTVNKGDKIALEITSLGSEGEGVGSYQGLKVFVEGALPGESIEAEILEVKKNYARGSLHSLHKTSPDRVNPICPLFGVCGGCQIMHLGIQGQLNAKKRRVEDALRRIGGLDVVVESCRASETSLSYRNKIQLPLVIDVDALKLGLFKKNSHEIIEVEKCYIHCEEGEAILTVIRPFLKMPQIKYVVIRNAIHTKEALVILVTTGKCDLTDLLKVMAEKLPQVKGVLENIHSQKRNVILSDHYRLHAGRDYLNENFMGKQFRIGAGAFFQVNTRQAESLFEEALKLAQLSPEKTVLDAYMGVGVLALLAANKVGQVMGIEVTAQAVENASENARLNNVTNCTFYVGKAEEIIRKLKTPDVVFLNPPRKGCEMQVIKHLIEQKVPQIIYVSCDPATLARDLALLAGGGYAIEKVIPFDMFPQTMHVETLVSLRR